MRIKHRIKSRGDTPTFGGGRSTPPLLVFSFFLFLISPFYLPSPAHASCVNPSGNAGDFRYYGGFQTPEYCDGATWVAMAPVGDTRTGLVGWWKFDETSGTTAADSSGRGNTFTISGSSTWVVGIVNNAISLTSTSTLVGAANIPSLAQFTASMWIKTASLGSAGQTFFLSPTTCPTDGFSFFDDGPYSSNVIFRVLNGSSHDITIPRSSVNDGNWHLLTGTYDGTTQAFYLDGVVIGRQAAGYTVDNSDVPYIAGPPSGSLIEDDVRIYNRALTPQDVHTLYTSTGPFSGDVQTGLVGWWKLDDGSSGTTPTTAVDSSGNGSTGTLTNGPTWTSSGKINNALNFNGSNNYVTGTGMPALTAQTLSAWIYPRTGGPGNVARIITIGSGTQVSILRMDFATGVEFIGLCSVSNVDVTNTGSVTANAWNHVVVTWNGLCGASASVTIAINGVPSTTTNVGSGTQTAASDSVFQISGTTAFDGYIDDVRVYNRALSASDVLTLYNLGNTACSSPTGWAGDLLYNATAGAHVPQFCNGSTWIPLGPVPGGSGSGCTSPTGNAGDMIYNKDKGYMQYCDSANWIGIGQSYYGPQQGLVGWWKFDETSGSSAADSSGNGNTGTLTNSPTWTASGQVNGALVFNGTSQYVTAPDVASLRLSGSWTVSTWVKLPSLPTSGNAYELLAKNDSSGNENYFLSVDDNSGAFGTTAPGKFVVGFANTSGSNFGTVSPISITLNTWYLVTGTWDGTTLSIYVNGAFAASSVPGAVPTSGSGEPFVIANDPVNYAYYANATIDDVRVYNRALSASEIWQLYLVTGGQ